MSTVAEKGRPLRNVEEIRSSYDAQADESYRKKIRNPFFERYGRAVGKELLKLEPDSLLDAGCGDGVTLMYAVMECPCRLVFGLDLSPRRLEIASVMMSGFENVVFQEGSFLDLHFGDDAIDVVFTSHALEPNGNKEVEAIRELKRVARRYVVLFEPDYEAAPLEGRARMRRLNYVTEIRRAIDEVGGLVVEKDEPFVAIGNPLNPTAVFVLRKEVVV